MQASHIQRSNICLLLHWDSPKQPHLQVNALGTQWGISNRCSNKTWRKNKEETWGDWGFRGEGEKESRDGAQVCGALVWSFPGRNPTMSNSLLCQGSYFETCGSDAWEGGNLHGFSQLLRVGIEMSTCHLEKGAVCLSSSQCPQRQAGVLAGQNEFHRFNWDPWNAGPHSILCSGGQWRHCRWSGV